MSIDSRKERRMARHNFKNFVPSNPEEAKYYEALKRVKKIKGFYTHAMVFVVINIMIVIVNIQNLEPGESYFQFKNFMTLFFWGIGLLGHGLSVFLPTIILGQDWEEKKIQQFMDQDKNSKWE